MDWEAGRIRLYRENPVVFVRDLFGVEPDHWQAEALMAFPHTPRLAMKACAGPGKTALLAWLGWNFMLTRPTPYVGCTSITGDNLRSGLWTEFSRWMDKSEHIKSQFVKTASKIFAKVAPDTWKIEARSWARDADPEQIGNALAGLHGEYVMWLCDESGDYPNAIMATCEGIFAGSPKEAHIVQAGNPTRRSGPLYEAWRNPAGIWRLVEITADPDDPHRTPRVSVEHARAMIAQYGRDNPWVKVKIFGQFPDSDFNALISEDEVRACFGRIYEPYDIQNHPIILAADVAQQGDDQSVIVRRQGLQGFKPKRFRNINSIQGAGVFSREWDDHKADAGFIDGTGGFGAGWVDQLNVRGYAAIPIGFANAAHRSDRFYNKRAEMYFDHVQWIKGGGALPESHEHLTALVNTTYSHVKDRLLLEPKEDVKAKIGFSPDETDAWVLTHAEPVAMKDRKRKAQARHTFDYDPFRPESSLASAIRDSYEPFR